MLLKLAITTLKAVTRLIGKDGLRIYFQQGTICIDLLSKKRTKTATEKELA